MQAKKAERKREEKSRRDEQRRQEGRQTGMNQGQEGRQARQSRDAAAQVVRRHSRRNELFLRKGEAAAKASKKKPALLSCFLSFFFSFFFLFFFLSFFLSFTHHPFLRLPSSISFRPVAQRLRERDRRGGLGCGEEPDAESRITIKILSSWLLLLR